MIRKTTIKESFYSANGGLGSHSLTADAAAVVTVNENPAWRSGEYFYGGDYADNTFSATNKPVEIVAVLPAAAPGGEDEISAVTGRVFVAKTPERFTYDADGNMTGDGRFTYTWNDENRMVMVSNAEVVVTYAYDHKGRMIRKDIMRTGSDTVHSEYIWDGWNIVREELRTPHAQLCTTHNLWGLDLDGTMQGAGGVGGLLAVVRDGETYLPTYDANGNVSEYVSAADGTVAAHYDYSPFGETLVASGPQAASFTHRFSTKPWCSETKLLEYQCRKYNPNLGRWMSRDPIGEKGGLNLLAFVFNQTIEQVDDIGRAPRYVYPGVRLIIDNGKGNIIPSPDWDWGDYDSEFGGKGVKTDWKPSFPSSTTGLTITFLMVTHEFIFSDGCSFYCISWTPVDLLGIGVETSIFKQMSPLTVTYGADKCVSFGTSGTTIDVNIGLGLSLPVVVHPSARLTCFALTEKSYSGCPCKELKPASIFVEK